MIDRLNKDLKQIMMFSEGKHYFYYIFTFSNFDATIMTCVNKFKICLLSLTEIQNRGGKTVLQHALPEI